VPATGMLVETAEAPGMRGRGRCSARAVAVKLSGRRDGVGLTHPLRGFVELAPFGRSVGFPPLRGARRARSLRSLGSNPRRAGMFILPRGNC